MHLCDTLEMRILGPWDDSNKPATADALSLEVNHKFKKADSDTSYSSIGRARAAGDLAWESQTDMQLLQNTQRGKHS